MSDRTYPREWFKVTRWYRTPQAQMFERETEQCIFWTCHGEQRRELKNSKYAVWYPTHEEAQAVIDARLKRETDDRNARRLGSLAPKLLEALEEVLDRVGALTNPNEFPNSLDISMERGAEILALIKNAKGTS